MDMTKRQLDNVIAHQSATIATQRRIIAAQERTIAMMEIGQATMERLVITYRDLLVAAGHEPPPLPKGINWTKQTLN